MIWLKGFVALLSTLFVIGGLIWIILQLAGLLDLRAPSAPGLDPADSALLQQTYDDLVAERDDAILARFVDGVDRTAASAELKRMRTLLPQEPKPTPLVANWSKTIGTDGEAFSAMFHYAYSAHLVVTQTELWRASAADPWRLRNFHLNVATEEEVGRNELNLTNKPPGFLAFLAAAALVPLFTWATFMVVLFRKKKKRRWLWSFAVIFCAPAFFLNGTTGAVQLQALQFLLFGASAMSSGSPLDPWIFGLAVPIGALVYWISRLWQKKEDPVPEAQAFT